VEKLSLAVDEEKKREEKVQDKLEFILMCSVLKVI